MRTWRSEAHVSDHLTADDVTELRAIVTQAIAGGVEGGLLITLARGCLRLIEERTQLYETLGATPGWSMDAVLALAKTYREDSERPK